jgi:hypothetical protein
MDRQALKDRALAATNTLLSKRIELAKDRLKRGRAEIRLEDNVGALAVAEANIKMAVSMEENADGKSMFSNETQRKAEVERRMKDDRWVTHWQSVIKRSKRKLLRLRAGEEVSSAYIKFDESMVAIYTSDLVWHANLGGSLNP